MPPPTAAPARAPSIWRGSRTRSAAIGLTKRRARLCLPRSPSGSAAELDALLTAFLAAALGEWGDKSQLAAALLAARYGKPGAVLAGISLAALANSALAAFGGALIHAEIVPRAAS